MFLTHLFLILVLDILSKMYQLISSILFTMEPEKAHYFTMDTLKKICSNPLGRALIKNLFSPKNNKSVQFCGLIFPNAIGLAAGFDKNASYIDELALLGFGHIEIGTVTPRPQEGNPKPRLFRLKQDQAVINRMGFNNQGVDVVVARLQRRKSKVIVGGNIGKNKDTPNENAVDDYLICFEKLYDYVDYFTVNVSSPNTPNLRALQDKEPLKHILTTLINKRKEYINQNKISRPILLKIAPDLNESQLNDIIDIFNETGIDGVVATNTTIERSNLKTPQSIIEKIGAGGLSGKPEKEIADRVLEYLSKNSNGKIPLIGVGGVSEKQDFTDKINKGASLVQVWTGFIYKGPSIVKNLLKP